MRQTTGTYVKDSANAVWYVVQHFDGRGQPYPSFYSDVRCRPQDLGQPASGQILPYKNPQGGGGGGGGGPAPGGDQSSPWSMGDGEIGTHQGVNASQFNLEIDSVNSSEAASDWAEAIA